MTYLAAGLVDRHADDLMLETAIAKLFCSEGLWQIVDDAVQIWGGEGYMREHGLERHAPRRPHQPHRRRAPPK